VTTRRQLMFSNERHDAIECLDAVASGKGWCNVIPGVTEDMPDLKMSGFGLWVSQGVSVATLVTAPARQGLEQASSLGLLHTRGRLGRARITELLSGAPFVIRQDHNQRGLLFDVAAGTPTALILDVMCSMSAELCEYELTGSWRMDVFLRQ
jgi:hypothetical protein